MENWEFLLQKEGDRTWLPLESTDVEILEGRYRLIARSNDVNTEIEIQIVYQSTEEHPPQRRVQKRISQTNPEGLIVIIPYTRLKPGIWEFSCGLISPDHPLENSQKSWIQLQVLSTEGELLSHPHFPEESSDDLGYDEDENLLETPSSLVSSEETFTQPDSEEIWEDHSSNLPESQPVSGTENQSEISSEENPPDSLENPEFIPPSPLTLKLTLDQDNLVVELGRPLTLYGRIDVLEKDHITDIELDYLEKIIQSATLQIQLRDPSQTEALAKIHHPLISGNPPWIFACILYIPSLCKSRVFLAEATLANETETFVSETFILNADVSQLLEVIEADFQEDLHQFSATKKTLKQNQIILDRTLLDLIESPPTSENFAENIPPDQVIIPPLIHSRENQQNQTLELPSFGQPLPPSVTAKISPQSDRLSPPVVPPKPPGFDLEKSPESTRVKAEIKELFSPISQGDRFWSRLNALASDGELLEWLKTNPNESESPSESPEQISPEPPEVSPPISTLTPLPRENQEIVVEDYEPPIPPQRSFKKITEHSPQKGSFLPTETPRDILPQKTPVPVPLLQVLSPEIIAGRIIKLRVEINEAPSRFYLKLWVYDRQSYNIIEGPRWLTDLVPGRLGMLEATTELEIPYGSLEIEIEAITVEVQTQRESHKTTILRRVLPPPPPSLPLENQQF